MENSGRTSIIAVPVIVLFAAFIAWAGSQGGFTRSGFPIFALCVALAFIINWIVFIPSYLKQTEKFFDLTGGITYLTVIWIAVLLSPVVDQRSWLLLAIVSVWAARLALFLFRRVQAAGEDRRFRDLKTSFSRFLLTWTLQGLWVSLTIAAALAAITSMNRTRFGHLWLTGICRVVGRIRYRSNCRSTKKRFSRRSTE